MQVDVIQLGVYTFATANIVLGGAAGLSTLVHSHRGLALTIVLWRWLWKLAGVYAVLAILAVGIPTSIDPLSATSETALSIACLAATVPTWWLLHRWRQRRRIRKAAARNAVEEATATAEHAARIRGTGRIRIG